MMISTFHIYVTLLVLSIQLCSSLEKYCQEAVKGIKKVDICPTSKEEWDKAESKKNCSVIAAMQNCTNTESFYYYCVIDRVRKETLELCAPKTIIRGHCPEFDYFSGIICRQESAECNRFSPKCDNMYNSSNAYESFDCYKLVCDSEFSNIPLKETTSDKTKFTVPVIATLACLTFVSFLTSTALYIKNCHNKPRQRQRLKEKEDANDYLKLDVDVAISTDELESKDLPLVEKETTKATLTTDDSTYSAKNVKEVVEMLETVPFIVRINDTDKGSTTDRHAFAMSTSSERLCKKNKEESSRYIRCFEEMDRYFVETKEFKEAEEIFHDYGIIIMTGLPGCGKTLAAVHLISKQLNSNWTFRKINSREDLLFVGKNEKTLLLIDNMLLDRTTKLEFGLWWEDVEWIYNEYIVHQPKAPCAGIVITTRKNVIKQASTYIKNVSPILNGVCSKDLRALTKKEKQNIFFKQIEFAHQVKKIETKNIGEITWTIGESEGPIGFPLCAHLYVCAEEYRKSGKHFFSRPIEYLKLQIKDEIERDKSNRTKSLFFVLFFREWNIKPSNVELFEIKNESHCQRFLDKIFPDLQQFGPFDFRDLESEAERLSDAFFKAVGKHMYTFFHDSVFEAVGAYFCETYVTEAAKYFPLDIIQNQKYENLTVKQQLTLITRLIYEIIDGRLNHVFSCRIFQNVNFVDRFCVELKKKDTIFIEKFVTMSIKSPFKLPTIFWSSYNNLTHLTELFYDIVKYQNIELDYQLYVSLYGLCCARTISELKTMPQNNITVLKDLVFKFRDHKGNCILHLIVLSDSSDEFVADAIKKLAEDAMVIHSKNFKGVTPLMFAVEQAMPRTKVIKTILRFSQKLNHRDHIKSSNVFHYCLRSGNDDEVCAKYLQILLKEKDAAKWLNEDDLTGNKALHIAAQETKRSRITSILELLESNMDTVDTLNEEGYSPLHLAIRSFKKDSKFNKIECCIRVIIITLYCVRANKLMVMSKTAIDECENECVKNILRNPKDCKNMKKNLDILFKEVNWIEDKEIPEALCSLSGFFNCGLQKSINYAVHHLKNIAF